MDKPCNVPRARLICCVCGCCFCSGWLFTVGFCFGMILRRTLFLLLVVVVVVTTFVRFIGCWPFLVTALTAAFVTRHSFVAVDELHSVRASDDVSLSPVDVEVASNSAPSSLRPCCSWTTLLLRISYNKLRKLVKPINYARCRMIRAAYLLVFLTLAFLVPCFNVIEVDNRTLTGSYDRFRMRLILSKIPSTYRLNL